MVEQSIVNSARIFKHLPSYKTGAGSFLKYMRSRVFKMSSMVAIFLQLGLLMAILQRSGVEAGVCYGMRASILPRAEEVVDLVTQINFRRMRIYEPNQTVLEALRDSEIVLTLGVPNADLQRLASNQDEANKWVQKNVMNYDNVQFNYIAVGNEVDPYNRNDPAARFLLQALRNVQIAISRTGRDIKVSTSINFNLLENTSPPSQAVFRQDIMGFINPIIHFLVNNGAPLLVNVYPYFAYAYGGAHLDFALFNPNDDGFQDGQFVYTNLFDAMVDSVYAALDKVVAALDKVDAALDEVDARSRRMDVVVSETGWPTAGRIRFSMDNGASLENAETYYRNLREHLQHGTPRSGGPVLTFIFAMFDENLKGPGIEGHWGLFYPNKQPKYQL